MMFKVKHFYQHNLVKMLFLANVTKLTLKLFSTYSSHWWPCCPSKVVAMLLPHSEISHNFKLFGLEC